MGFTISFNYPAFWFIHILIHGREEWVIVLLASQQKRVKQPVRPEYPDYSFLVTMI